MPDTVLHSVSVPEPPAALLSFVERQIRDTRFYDGLERRSERRCLMAVPVLAQPMDAEFNPTRKPFVAVTRDISPSGVGLVCEEAVTDRLLALRMRLAEQEVKLVVDVLWCKALGPYHHIGGKPTANLSSLPDQVTAAESA